MALRDDRLFHPEFSTDPYWWRAWRPAPERGRGDVPAKADVALIGGGLASLNAALELARANYAQQREPADARLLLEAALAARQPAAAEPALKWLAESGIESVALKALAAQLGSLR